MELIYPLAAALLGIVLLVVWLRTRAKPSNKDVGEAATRAQYREPESVELAKTPSAAQKLDEKIPD